MKQSPPIVEMRGATLLFAGRRLFPRTSLAIRRGEHWAIVGPNGSGKTALALALSGDVPVADGDVIYPLEEAGREAVGRRGSPAGQEVLHVSFEDQRDLVAGTSCYLQGRYESLEGEDAPTVAAFLGLPRSPRGRAIRLDEGGLLRRLGLWDLLDRRIIYLSNGEARKLLEGPAGHPSKF
jgi:molybdate transport system ATP-binding protein